MEKGAVLCPAHRAVELQERRVHSDRYLCQQSSQMIFLLKIQDTFHY